MVDYFNLDDVMRELALSEEDVFKMVSEGELRAFKSEGKVKFRKEDVENLRKGRVSEPTVILPEGETTEETVLDLDIDSEAMALSDTSAPSLEETDATTLESVSKKGEKGGLGDDELMVAEEPAIAEAEETVLDEAEETGTTTAPLSLADESEETVGADVVDEETTETGDEAIAEEGLTTAAAGRGRRLRGYGAPEAVAVAAPKASWVWTLVLFIGFLPGAFGALVLADGLQVDNGYARYPLLGSVYEGILKSGLFWGDAAWRRAHESRLPKNGSWEITDPVTKQTVSRKLHEGPTFMQRDVLSSKPAEGTP